MASNVSDERNELQDDDEKLQTALHEIGNQWDYEDYYSDDDEEDDDQLLIDLEYEKAIEQSEQTEANFTATSFAGTTSRSQSDTAADEESGETFPRPSLELPSQVDVIEHRNDPEKTLHLNRILQEILEDHINDIKEALKENKEKQAKLEENISDTITKPERTSVYVGTFRAPYFRHINSYPPSNEDVVQKKYSGDYNIITADSVKDLRQFNRSAKVILRDAVIQDCLEQMLKPIIAKMETECKKKDECQEEFDAVLFKLKSETSRLEELQKGPKNYNVEHMIEEEKKTIEELKRNLEAKGKLVEEFKQEVARLEQEIQDKKNISKDSILATVDTNKVDWMKIAKKNFGGNSSWLDCQKAWENLVSPTINKKAWTKEEDKVLVKLVSESTTCNWEKIAKAFGNGRTAFQCFSRYQQRFNSDLKPRPWTKDEDARLISITNNVKDSVGFFSWSKVSTLMDSRSPVECMYRFTKIDPSQARGRWTELEDAKLLAAVQMIGPSWSKVSKFIGTRNMVQCRDRYLNCLAPNINFFHFSYEEDVKLLKLYKKLGSSWAKMVPEFLGRTDSMLLIRYRQLQKWKQQTEWFNRQTAATKKMLLGKSLTVAERQRFQARTEDYMKIHLGIGSEDYKRQELDRLNNVDPDIIPPRPPRHLRCYSIAGSNKSGSMNKWTMKLDIHKRLTENLHRLLEKEAETNKEKKSKGNPKLTAEVEEQIMHKSVEETLKTKSLKTATGYTKGQVRKLEAALNKAFLTEGTVSVQELLQSKVLEKRKVKKVERNAIVDSELKNILRRRSRTLSKHGRSRRFFERDTRPLKVIEEELDELDQSVPLMMMKNLGVDVHYLCKEIRLHCLQFQEELSNQPAYEDDEDFQREDAETQEAIQKLSARTDITDLYKQQRLSILNGKLKSLRKIYDEKKYLNTKILENKVSTFQDDLDYLETLIDEKLELEVNKNLSLMACGTREYLETDFEAEIMETRSSSVTSTSSSSFIQLSLSTEMSHSQSSVQSPAKTSFASVSQSDGDRASDSMANSEFAVPLLPSKRKRIQYSSSHLSNRESSQKRLKVLSKDEIAEERRKLPYMKKTIFTKLPNLPPNLSTLLGLRALLLRKHNLIDTAGSLYKPTNHGTTSQLVTDTADETLWDVSNSAPNSQDVNTEDSGSWFLYTTPQQLQEQASSFQGYSSQENAGLQKQKYEQDLVSMQNETLLFPLEERGGHLPESGSRSSHDYNNVALKPVTCTERELPVYDANEMSNSNYEVVMRFSGCHIEEDTLIKAVEKHPPKKIGGINNPITVKSSVSIIPASVIKTDTVNPSISVSDSCSSRTTLSSCGDATVETISNSWSNGSMYSQNFVGKTEDQDDDDGDVVAVVHLDDDDASLTPTVISICSGLTSSNWSELSANNKEIVILSENGEESQYINTAQAANQSRELNGLELPESCISSIMNDQKLNDQKSKVVIVGVDGASKTIVHFRSEENKFTAFETLATSIVEARSGRHRNVFPSVQENNEKTRDIPDCMKVIRNTDEYKLLLSRFHALFTWPVLISTLKPSPFSTESLPPRLCRNNLPHMKRSEKQRRKKKRFQVKQSAAQREHLRSIRKYSLITRAKKMVQKMTKNASVVENSVDTRESTVVGLDQEATVSANADEYGQDERATVTNVEVPVVSVDKCVPADEDEDDDNNDDDDEGAEVKRRVGRPRGSRSKKHEQVVVLREKSKRIRKPVQKDPPPKEPIKEYAKSLPQWWKDAILAVMLAKKAMEIDGEEDVEVNIEDDDDFIDKGNYSDDEWYQQLRDEEMGVAILKDIEHEIYISDAEETASDSHE